MLGLYLKKFERKLYIIIIIIIIIIITVITITTTRATWNISILRKINVVRLESSEVWLVWFGTGTDVSDDTTASVFRKP